MKRTRKQNREFLISVKIPCPVTWCLMKLSSEMNFRAQQEEKLISGFWNKRCKNRSFEESIDEKEEAFSDKADVHAASRTAVILQRAEETRIS